MGQSHGHIQAKSVHEAHGRRCAESVAGLQSLWPPIKSNYALHSLMLLQDDPGNFGGWHEKFMHLFLPKGGDFNVR